ncbi:uncharacterized protein LOC113512100 isoform X2 [Galleria mellonella]|uniref:Uncharacterized protein LOC113512100 isoform X2 n=1 Tax=Galleria mellonella TaxID=7137 RepID=A0A6J1WDK7_GALME|nr:uncharacterized protein LOC113512100 isoform X2 [Galleria mellonella]
MLSDFAKEKVFWTRKMNLKLVKFIESKPNIWNPKHPKYTSVKSRDQTYAEFARKYGNEFTGQAVKDRWTNIRSTYANYLRKLNASRAKGDGEEYTVNWHLWEACQFLTKVNKRLKNDSAAMELNSEEIEEQEDIPVEQKEDWSSDDYQDISNNQNIKCKSIIDNLIKVFKGVQNDAFGLDNTKHGHVGRIVTKKLSEMNSYDAAMVSQKIMDILLLYNENNPQNPNNIT